MQERLIVKNFGPIKEVDLDLSQTTIFIGEQAGGKSTLAKLIGIFRDSKSILLLKNNDKTPFIDFLIDDFFSKNTYFYYQSDILHFTFQDEKFTLEKDEITSKFVGNQKVENQIMPLLDFVKKLNQEQSAGKRRLIETEMVLKLFQSGNNETIELLLNIFALDIYIPAERTLIPMIMKSLFSIIDLGIALPKTITGFGNKYEQARQNIKNYSIDFLDIKYQFSAGKDIIYHNDSKLDLANSSSGLQALAPMLLVIEAFSNPLVKGHFIIEEPELNLYPTTQHNLTKFIAAKCTAENQQLTITTHSPYLLSSLNILLFAYQAGQIDAAETDKIIPKASWINPQNFNAYFIEKGGTARPIFDKKTGMIAENELDNVSLDLGDEFDSLMDIYQSVPA